jgi:molecular chaperone DnaK (HSP70)
MPVLGIDLGTSSCSCSYYDGDRYHLIRLDNNYILNSTLYFKNNNEIVYGKLFSEIKDGKYQNYISNSKRIFGKRFNHPDIVSFIKSYHPLINQNNKPYFKTEYDIFDPLSIMVLLLKHIIGIVKSQIKILGNPQVVLTIPAYMTESDKKLIEYACNICKIELLRIIAEPISAILAYQVINKKKENENILVFDLGGGTLDLTLVNYDEGIFEIISTEGDSFLGGQDITDLIVKDAIHLFNEENQIDHTRYHGSKIAELIEKIDKMKKLNNYPVNIKIDNFWGMNSLEYLLTEEKLRVLIRPLLKRIDKCIDKLLKNFREKIDNLILVGGGSKMTLIKEYLEEKLKIQPKGCEEQEFLVAIGAGIQGYIINNPDKEINMMELALIDVVPLSIGVELSDGKFSKIIKKNTPLPITEMMKYYLAPEEDNIVIKLYQGERLIAKENQLISIINVNLPPNPKKYKNIITLTLHLSFNGHLSIKIKENITNSEINKEIENVFLSKEEIIKIINQANQYKDTDELNLKSKELNEKYNKIINNININLNKIKSKMNKKDYQIVIEDINYFKKEKEKWGNLELNYQLQLLEKKYQNLI